MVVLLMIPLAPLPLQDLAEEVGVEHLLRDIRGATESTVADRASARLAALHGLKRRLEDVAVYLSRVADGTLPANQDVLKDVLKKN